MINRGGAPYFIKKGMNKGLEITYQMFINGKAFFKKNLYNILN